MYKLSIDKLMSSRSRSENRTHCRSNVFEANNRYDVQLYSLHLPSPKSGLNCRPTTHSTDHQQDSKSREIPLSPICHHSRPLEAHCTPPRSDTTLDQTDFTRWSYSCPQIEQAWAARGRSLTEDDVRCYDEFACLNCTITAAKVLESGMTDLPVMVYLHCDAFVEGYGNIAARHDTSRIVALSIEKGMPVVIVSLHYR